MTQPPNKRALAVPLSRFTSRVGGGSAFFDRLQIFFATFARRLTFQNRRGGGVIFRVAQADVQFFRATVLK